MQNPPELPQDPEMMLIDDVVQTGQLLSNLRWSRVWHSINVQQDQDGMFSEGVAAQEVIEETGIPQSTVYQDLEALVELGAVTVHATDRRDRMYRASGGHLQVTQHIHTEPEYINPVTIGVVGMGFEHDEVENFLERTSYGKLHELILVSHSIDDDKSFSSLYPDLPASEVDAVGGVIREVRTVLEEETPWGGQNEE